MHSVLNLSKTFKLTKKMIDITFKKFTFSGGEEHIKITNSVLPLSSDVTIATSLSSSSDIMTLLLATDVIKSISPHSNISLFAPYFPYARQDRRMVYGEPLSIKVMTGLVNNLNFKNVYVLDPHSGITEVLLDNIQVLPRYKLVKNAIESIIKKHDYSKLILVSPDAGGEKKTFETAGYFNLDIIYGSKHRDVSTGKITRTSIIGDPKDKVCIIVDDIIDGGATFIELAKMLKTHGASHVYLIVSHGIFSKGVECLGDLDGVYTTDSICKINDPKVSIIKLDDLYSQYVTY